MDELEQRINFCHTKGMEDEEDYERASKAVGAATGNKPKKSAATPAGKCFLFCFVLFFLKIAQLAVSLLYVIHQCEILSFFFFAIKTIAEGKYTKNIYKSFREFGSIK